jgi:hypothetical protein
MRHIRQYDKNLKRLNRKFTDPTRHISADSSDSVDSPLPIAARCHDALTRSESDGH